MTKKAHQVKPLCRCGGKLKWISEYGRYYCYKCHQYPPTCPICGKDLFWVPQYRRYYCNQCGRYVNPKPKAQPPPSTLSLGAHTPQQALSIFKTMKDKYVRGQISRDEFSRWIRNFKFRDPNGRFWTVGAQSGAWYHHDGERWVRGAPPPILFKAFLEPDFE